MSRACAKRWICLIWLLSFTIALPWAYYFQLQSHSSYQGSTESSSATFDDANEQRINSRSTESGDSFSWTSDSPIFNFVSTNSEQNNIDYDSNGLTGLPDYEVCVEIWPNETSERTYFVFANLILCYLLPLLLISACYIAIWLKVWRRSVPGETGSRALKSLSNTNKATRATSHRSTSGKNSDQTQSESNVLTCNEFKQKSPGWRRFWCPRWQLSNPNHHMNKKSSAEQIRKRHISAEIGDVYCPKSGSNDMNPVGSRRLERLVCGEPEISSTSFDYSEQSLQLIHQPLPPKPPPTPVFIEDQRDNITLSTSAAITNQHTSASIPSQPLSHTSASSALLKRYLSSEQLTSAYTRRLFYNGSVSTTNGSVRSIKHQQLQPLLSSKLCSNKLPGPIYPQNGLRISCPDTTAEALLKESAKEFFNLSLDNVTPKKIHSAGNLLNVDTELNNNHSTIVRDRPTSVSAVQLSPMKKLAYSIARAGFWRSSRTGRLPGTFSPVNDAVQIKSSVPSVSNAELLCGSTSAQLGLKMELILQRSKLKVAKMMIVVVLFFFLSWFPLYFVFTKLKLGLQFTSFQNAEERVTILMAPFAQWLGATNSCVNPILYCYFNTKYRKEFANLLAKLRSTSCGQWIRRQTADPLRRPATPLQPQPLSECSLKTTRASINRLGQAAQMQRFGDELNTNDRVRCNTLATAGGKFV